MMNHFEDIEKKIPFVENEEYVDALIKSSTEKAIAQSKIVARHKRMKYPKLAVAAAVAVLIIVGAVQIRKQENLLSAPPQAASPIDEFLNDISDEDAMMLTYYEIEEISEY